MVGIELGNNKTLTTAVHVAARIPSALAAGRRLAGLSLPTAIAAQMWCTAVLRRFHLSLCSRLAEVLRRREQLLAQDCPSPTAGGSSSAAPGPATSTRALTVADLRAAETSPSSAVPSTTSALA